MDIGLAFIIIGVISVFIFNYRKTINLNQFIKDTQPYFKFLIEEDYYFLLKLKYGQDVDINVKFGNRIRNGFAVIIAILFLGLTRGTGTGLFIVLILSLLGGYFVFKMDYMSLKGFYKRRLYNINAMLPYYLKSLEILIQHYTIPVALRKSIDTAPEIFRVGLTELVNKIEAGDSTVQPYMDFATDYPVRDSMRMMRLLYRLGIGSQDNKEQQLIMFSRTISSLQNKAREQKYKERLDTMERKTMIMLFATGGGILGILLFSMVSMIGI